MALNKKDLDFLLTQASVKLVGSTAAATKAELYAVLDEFFDVTSAWQEWQPLDAQAYQHTYQIAPAEGGKIIRLGGVLASLNYSTNALLEAAEALHTDAQPGWQPIAASMSEFGELRIPLPPSNPQAMKVILIKNVDTAETNEKMIPNAPDWVLTYYGRHILDGILGKMMGSPNKSYTSDTLSVYHLKRFQEGMSRARVAALKRNTYGAQAWAYPRQFLTRNQRGYMSVGTGNDRSF